MLVMCRICSWSSAQPRILEGGLDNRAYNIDWPSDLYVLPAGCHRLCHHDLSPDVTGCCLRILGYLLCLLSCSVYWSNISCYLCHFCYCHLSRCWRSLLPLEALVFAPGVEFRKDIETPRLANLATTVMNLHGFVAPADYKQTLIEVAHN